MAKFKVGDWVEIAHGIGDHKSCWGLRGQIIELNIDRGSIHKLAHTNPDDPIAKRVWGPGNQPDSWKCKEKFLTFAESPEEIERKNRARQSKQDLTYYTTLLDIQEELRND